MLGYSLKPFGARASRSASNCFSLIDNAQIVVHRISAGARTRRRRRCRRSSSRPDIADPSAASSWTLDDAAIAGSPYAQRRFFVLEPSRLIGSADSSMEKSLARYIWTHTWRQQLWILVIVAAVDDPLFHVVRSAEADRQRPDPGRRLRSAGRHPDLHAAVDIDVPFIGHGRSCSTGFELDRMQMLMALSCVFLLLVIINGLFKFYINTYKGRLGERMLRRIRFELVDRVLRFPPDQFKRVKSAEVATMVKDEVEPLGGFIGDAFVQPALLGGQALTALVFIMVQNFWLG